MRIAALQYANGQVKHCDDSFERMRWVDWLTAFFF